MIKIEKWRLQQRQSLPLSAKEQLTENRIREWYNHFGGQVYVSFSGGKDSTVLLHIVRKLYPKIPAVFIDTGLEYPEIRDFVRSVDNVVWLKPKMKFIEVIDKYGYPVVSKEISNKISDFKHTKNIDVKNRLLNGTLENKYSWKIPNKWKFLLEAPFKISDKCCHFLKKAPAREYEKRTGNAPFIGNKASDSGRRSSEYLIRGGCNSFTGKHCTSLPLSIWTDKDILEYIDKYNLALSKIYSMGWKRTGCSFCLFGVHLEDLGEGRNRFHLMKKTHPQLYNYCINKLGLGKILDYIGVDYTNNNTFSKIWEN